MTILKKGNWTHIVSAVIDGVELQMGSILVNSHIYI